MNTIYRKNSPFRPTTIDICPNACEAFTSPDDDECSTCFEPRYVVGKNGKKEASRTHQQLPIAAQIVSIFTNPNFIKAISVDCSISNSSTITNIFSQSLFKEIKDKNIISSQFDLFLALYIDGYQTHKRGGTKLNIIMLHILNLPESERYK